MAAFEKIERARRRTPPHPARCPRRAGARLGRGVRESELAHDVLAHLRAASRACDSLRNNPNFEMFIFVCVLVNGVLIALKKPGGAVGRRPSAILPKATSAALQATFVVIFTLEAL